MKYNRDYYRFRYRGYWGYNPRLVDLSLCWGEPSNDEMYTDEDYADILYIEERPGLFSKYRIKETSATVVRQLHDDEVEIVPLVRLAEDVENEAGKADKYAAIAYEWHNGNWVRPKNFDVKTF